GAGRGRGEGCCGRIGRRWPRARARGREWPWVRTPPLPLEEAAVLDEGAEERLEDQEPIGAPHRALGSPFGVRHQAEDRAVLVDDPGDVLQRSIGIGGLRQLALGGRIPEHDLPVAPERSQRVGFGVVLALTVRDRHGQHLARPHTPRERRLDVLDAEPRGLAAVLQTLVTHERAGQEPRLAEDLEAVAGAEHVPTPGHEVRERIDDRRPASDRAGPQVVTIREPAGQDHAVEAAQIAIAMPEELDGLVMGFGDDVVEVVVAPRSGEHHHAESHGVDDLLSGNERPYITTVTRWCNPRERDWPGAAGTSRRRVAVPRPSWLRSRPPRSPCRCGD